MADYDVIVIGAGNGGLSAAASLAQRGMKVLLMERHNVPGGCATSFIRGRFEFEVALHQLSGLGSDEKPGPLRGVMHKLNVLGKLEFVEEDAMYRFVIPGKFSVTLQADRDKMVVALQEKFPDEAAAIKKFFDFVWEFCNQMVSIYFMHDPEASKEKYPTYFKNALRNSKEILDEYFQNPYLKTVISIYCGYVGMSPSNLSFMDLAMLLWAYAEFKPYHIKGGSQAMSNAILDTFLTAGGRAQFNCAAKKIIIDQGKVKGVLTESGDEISANYVISNASTLSSYLDLIGPENLPDKTMKMLGSRTIGTSAFNIYCGLDCLPESLGIDVGSQFISMRTDMNRESESMRSFDVPDTCLMTCYNLADPGASPPGTSQVVLCILHYADQWINIPPAQYAEKKYAYAQHVLNIVERLYPGFKDAIEEMEVATPLTMMRYLGHPGGAIYGFDQYAKDSNLFVSPLGGIEGLYFAGSWAGMGGFQPTLESGFAAAKAIYKKHKEAR